MTRYNVPASRCAWQRDEVAVRQSFAGVKAHAIEPSWAIVLRLSCAAVATRRVLRSLAPSPRLVEARGKCEPAAPGPGRRVGSGGSVGMPGPPLSGCVGIIAWFEVGGKGRAHKTGREGEVGHHECSGIASGARWPARNMSYRTPVGSRLAALRYSIPDCRFWNRKSLVARLAPCAAGHARFPEP